MEVKYDLTTAYKSGHAVFVITSFIKKCNKFSFERNLDIEISYNTISLPKPRNQGIYFHRICRYKIEIDSVSVYIIFLMCQNMPLSVKSIFVS